jgi:hypothetical protein
MRKSPSHHVLLLRQPKKHVTHAVITCTWASEAAAASEIPCHEVLAQATFCFGESSCAACVLCASRC